MARVYGEPHFSCHICGFDFPISQGVRHYKKKKLVDRKCADDIAADDLYAMTRLPREQGRNSVQPVSEQGFQGYDEENFDGSAGAGEVGAGWGGAGT